jgi:signal transduction histidine kinase
LLVVTAPVEPPLADPHAILRLLPHGVALVGPDWHMRFVNPEGERLLGARGSTLWERCPELESTAFASAFRYAMADRTEILTESTLPSVGWCQARARPTPDGGILVSLRQVHAGTIETGQARLALLAGEIGDALAREDSLDRALERCARATIRHLDAAIARVWVVVDEEHALVPCAIAGAEVPHALPLAIGDGKIGQIADEGTPYLTNDVATDPIVGAAPWVRSERLVSFAGYPLRIENRVVGVLELYSRRPIDHDVLNNLSAIADTLALGIERKGGAAGRRRAEERLRTQADQLEILHELGKHLAAELDVVVLAGKLADAAGRMARATCAAVLYDAVRRPDGEVRCAVSGTDALAPIGREVLSHGAVRYSQGRGDLPVPSVLGVPITGRSGRVIGAIVVGSDRLGAFSSDIEQLLASVATSAAIALDNARLFGEARSLIGALEKSNRELDQFAYVASHDLKAPLRGIANLAQWIEDDMGTAMSADTRNHLELLRGRVVRLEYLIAGILAYSRAARDTNEHERIDVRAIAREVWELLAPPATAHLEILDDLPAIAGSRTQLQQVLLNLVGNALKYNANRELHVTIGGRVVDGVPQFYVCDDGVGIPDEFHDRIWGLFQTLERRDKVESTGIGLSIVRKIVESRGGRAWLESREAGGRAGGACFYFTWPGGTA